LRAPGPCGPTDGREGDRGGRTRRGGALRGLINQDYVVDTRLTGALVELKRETRSFQQLRPGPRGREGKLKLEASFPPLKFETPRPLSNKKQRNASSRGRAAVVSARMSFARGDHSLSAAAAARGNAVASMIDGSKRSLQTVTSPPMTRSCSAGSLISTSSPRVLQPCHVNIVLNFRSIRETMQVGGKIRGAPRR
jgi:hypothetical protein